MKKILIGLIVIVVIAIAALLFAPSALAPEVEDTPEVNSELSVSEEEVLVPAIEEDGESTLSDHANVVVEYTSDGFEPSSITIASGDVVTFINRSSGGMWPASDVHPIHSSYPGSGIDKCGGSEEELIFDACGSVEVYEFAFTEVGSWEFHNHVRSSHGGVVVVE